MAFCGDKLDIKLRVEKVDPFIARIKMCLIVEGRLDKQDVTVLEQNLSSTLVTLKIQWHMLFCISHILFLQPRYFLLWNDTGTKRFVSRRSLLTMSYTTTYEWNLIKYYFQAHYKEFSISSLLYKKKSKSYLW